MTITAQQLKADRDFCRVTGCAPIKGAKTTRTPRAFLRGREVVLVANGINQAASIDGRTVYQREQFTRKGTTYSRVRRSLKTN